MKNEKIVNKQKSFLKTLLIGIILVITISLINNVFWILSSGADFPVSILMPILTIFVIKIFSQNKVSNENMTIIYSMILISLSWSVIPSFWIAQASGLAYIPRLKSIVFYWIPSIWTPRSPLILKGMFLGGLSIPWNTWLTSMLFWMCIAFAWAFLLISMIPLFGKIFVDIERLTFPISTIPISIIGKDEKSIRDYLNDILFIGGLLIAILFILPDVINMAVRNPNFLPSPSALTSIDWHQTFPEIKYIFKGSVLYTTITPLMFSFAYLLPLDVLLTQWITYIILMIILPMIDIYMIHPERFREYVNSPGYAWDMSISPSYSVWRTEALTLIGGMYGLALFYIVYNWRNIVDWLKDTFKSSENRVESMSIIFFAFSAIILLLLLSISGIPIILSIVLIILLILSSIGMSVIRASGGGNLLNGLVIGGASNRLFTLAFLYDVGSTFGIFNPRPNPSPFQSCFTTMQAGIVLNGDNMAWNPLALGLESYRIGSEYKVDIGRLFTSQTIAVMIAILISFPTAIWTFYNYGIENLIYTYHSSIRDIYAEAFTRDLTLYYTNVGPSNVQLSAPYLPQTLIGMIITILLMYIRILKPGFPLNPVGYVLGGSFFTYQWWTSFLAAWIVKYIIIKIGGAKLYNRTIKFVIGTVLGTAIGFLLLWIASLTA